MVGKRMDRKVRKWEWEAGKLGGREAMRLES